MKKPVPDLADRQIVTVNLGGLIGRAVRQIAEENQLNISMAVRLLLKKALAKPGALAKFSERE